jgi:predicted GIY-YIG superfamily endonuclease
MYYYVYILKSEKFTETYYTGFTTKLEERLSKHNNGEVPHTSKYKPWKFKNIITFTDKDKALAFEKYLKSHSGRAFAKKHF